MRRILALPILIALSGCFLAPKTASDVMDAARVACIIANAFLPSNAILSKCGLTLDAIDSVNQVAGEHRAGVAREMQRVGACREEVK